MKIMVPFFREVIEMCNKNQSENQMWKHFKSDVTTFNLGINQLMLKFLFIGHSKYSEFNISCYHILTSQLEVYGIELRYGRTITSKVYDVSYCKKCDGIFL